MKKLTLIAVIAFAFACKAQSPIIDINDKDSELITGAYLKDVYNELDKFVGTWLYTNGNDSLTIVFQKKIQVYNGKWYEDLLVGEYRYVKDGVEEINTLNNFNIQSGLESFYDHNLIGNYMIFKKEFPGCSNCDISEKRVRIYVTYPDPQVEYLDGTLYMGLRYIDVIPEQLQIDFARKGAVIKPTGAPDEPNLPFGRYVLTKQL